MWKYYFAVNTSDFLSGERVTVLGGQRDGESGHAASMNLKIGFLFVIPTSE